jgi:hypothetical protein
MKHKLQSCHPATKQFYWANLTTFRYFFLNYLFILFKNINKQLKIQHTQNNFHLYITSQPKHKKYLLKFRKICIFDSYGWPKLLIVFSDINLQITPIDQGWLGHQPTPTGSNQFSVFNFF